MCRKVWKKILSKKEKEKISRLGESLNNHAVENKNTDYINHKIFYLLPDPFTIINAYTKISKDKGALTEGHNDSKDMKYFGIKQAKRITEKIKKETYEFRALERTWIPKPGKKKKDH